MKSKEELDALKEEVEAVSEKCRELTPEELAQVTGGRGPVHILEYVPEPLDIHFKFYNDPPAL